MSEFIKKYKKWHAENNMKYDSATQYHKALQSRFGNWRSPSDFRKLQYELNNAEMMLGLKKVAVKNLLSEKRQLRQEVEKLKANKQLVVVPKMVGEQIERVKGNVRNPVSLGLFDSNYEAKPEYAKWIQDNINTFMSAWIDGYTVEKEQLYEIRIPLPNGNYASIDSKGYIWGELIPNKYKLTESEVKNIDERYWAFAVPV